MDALHPRLLVTAFAETFRFYDAVLPALFGAVRAQGGEEGPYAHWDVGDEGLLTLMDRRGMAGLTGGEVSGDRSMNVCRVPDVDKAYDLCLRHGAKPVAAPVDRPEWGPNLRTAHLRDPEGNLLELQSY
ncbi:VOC family protein [Nonomuraea sp. NPDC050556]|uniref:VOC family protein n=1 Tax=Nonomuraea sp. NPDC050556 TaxID=3364369 RepID=UPI0037A70192